MNTNNLSNDNETAQESRYKNVDYAIKRLEKVSSWLRILGNAIFFSTLANIFSTFATFYFNKQWSILIDLNKNLQQFQSRYYVYNVEQLFYISVFLSFSLFLISIFFLISYDKQKRQGNVLFEEISDELQWWVLSKKIETNKNKEVLEKDRPILNVRIALREYTHTTELPLIKGTYSMFFYLLLNIVSVTFTSVAMYLSTANVG